MSTLHPAALLAILFKRKWTLVFTFLAVVLGTAAYLLLATPLYQSTAELVIRFGDRSIPTVDRAPQTELTPADRREIVLANGELLQSSGLVRATIAAIGLERIYPDIVEDPPTRWSAMDEAERVFMTNLTIDIGQQSNVITASLLHRDINLAPVVLSKLIELYIAREAEVYRDPQVSFQRAGVTQAEERLAAAQRALEAFKARNGITDFDQEIIDLLKRRGDADASLRAAQATLSTAERRRQDLQRLMTTVPERLAGPPSGEKYRGLDDAQSRLAELRARQSQMLATYAPDSPALDQVRAGVANAEREVRSRSADVGGRAVAVANPVFQTLQTDYFHAVADAQAGVEPVRIYTQQVAEANARLSALQQARGGMVDAMREVQLADDSYRALTRQLEAAQIKEGLNTRSISSAALLSPPTQPYRTARPRRLITALAGLLGGGILALGLALLREAMDDRFTTPDQLAAALGVPVLAAFPKRAWTTAEGVK